jgi:hypothetical protein
MSFSCECCVLPGRDRCDELITRSQESYRLSCVVVCDLETSRLKMWRIDSTEEAISNAGPQHPEKKKLRRICVVRTVHFLMKLYNDQHNAQVLIYLSI